MFKKNMVYIFCKYIHVCLCINNIQRNKTRHTHLHTQTFFQHILEWINRDLTALIKTNYINL